MKQHEMSCPYPEGCNCGATEWNRLTSELEWYKNRIKLLEASKNKFREPELTILIDVIANGQLLPDPDGRRYGPKLSSKTGRQYIRFKENLTVVDRIAGSKEEAADIGIAVLGSESKDSVMWDFELVEIKISDKVFLVTIMGDDDDDYVDIVFENGVTFGYVDREDFEIVQISGSSEYQEKMIG